jgi:RNase P/RNase MRP subunit POP5
MDMSNEIIGIIGALKSGRPDQGLFEAIRSVRLQWMFLSVALLPFANRFSSQSFYLLLRQAHSRMLPSTSNDIIDNRLEMYDKKTQSSIIRT